MIIVFNYSKQPDRKVCADARDWSGCFLYIIYEI